MSFTPPNNPADPTPVTFTSERSTIYSNFSWALTSLKNGCRIARAGWNGKNMWLEYIPSNFVLRPAINKDLTFSVPCEGYIAMYTAKGTWQPGWTPSQSDLFANDWFIIPGQET